MTISDLVQISNDQATTLGWNDKKIDYVEQIALIHSEASEALESYRNKEELWWLDRDGKPQGILSEYADILIRIGHYVGQMEVEGKLVRKQFEDMVAQKLEYNLTRSYRHGGKEI